MQFAILNGDRIEAKKGIRAICPCCGDVLIAKCGDYKVHHWAHKGRRNCDPWWETETDWHRNWKNEFDNTWHEVILFDENTGEKHIADIKTPENTIIEFQHSSITEIERISRETFYMSFAKNMVWVLDCSERGLAFIFFQGFISDGVYEMNKDKAIYWFGRHKLIEKWVGSKAFVLLDFGGDVLWWLKSYDKVNKLITVNPRYRRTFIEKQIR